MPNVGAQIEINQQALAALRAADGVLTKAQILAPTIRQGAAIAAALSLVKQRRGYLQSVEKSVPLDDKPVTPTLRARVQLAIDQADGALRAVDVATNDEHSFAEELIIALRTTLTATIDGISVVSGRVLTETIKATWPLLLIAAAVLFILAFVKQKAV